MTTAIESKQDATKQSQKEQLETFSCMLDIGEAMLAAGADVDTVEDILVKMGKAYGAYKMDVLVITELIIATATMPGHNEHTLSRRILNEGSTNFDRLKHLPTFASHTVKARSLQTICAKACSASKESRSQRFRSTWVAHLQQVDSPSSSEDRLSTGSFPLSSRWAFAFASSIFRSSHLTQWSSTSSRHSFSAFLSA